MSPKARWGILVAVACALVLMVLYYSNPAEVRTPLSNPGPNKTLRQSGGGAVATSEPEQKKGETGGSEDIKPTVPAPETPGVDQFTEAQLRSMEMEVIQDDGSINPQFFRKFGFTADQEVAFRAVWADKLDLLQRIESYKIEEEESESGTKKFWIKEFPVEGADLHDTTAKALEGKIPEQALKFFLEFNDQDVRYTFSNFGKYRRQFELTTTNDGFEMVENFYSVADSELTLVGWRKHKFQTPPPRFERLFADKPW